MGKIKRKLENTFFYTPLKYIVGKLSPYILNRIKYGNAYVKTWKFLNESEYWSEDKIKQFQLEQLKKNIHHAYNNVPYYKRIFDENSLKVKDIQNFQDIKKIPYLTKDIINKHKKEIIDKNFPQKYLGYGTTGGSTGKPMGFYFDKRVQNAIEQAYMKHQWKRVGYKERDKCVRFRGNVVDNIIKNKKYWSMAWSYNWLIMSSYHLTDNTIPLYINKIRRFKPKFIQAYPSALHILVLYMKKNNIEPFNSVKAILCGSENLYQWQRELFEDVLKTKVYSWYGHGERACLAGECEKSHYYHSFPQYGYLELINEKGELCTEEDERGEIVITGFTNYVMPFIRYKTQDIAINTNKKCECGRNWKLIKNVEGRLQDYVIGKNNGKITLTALIFAQHFKAFSKIKNMQLFQNEIGVIIVRIVENEKLQEDDKNEIIDKMKNASSNNLDIFLEFVNEISRTKSGKYRFLIQKLPIRFGDR